MDQHELGLLYRQYGPSVLQRARTITGNEADAQDVLQEVFVILLNKGDSFRGEANLMTWVYRITTNACLERMRTTKRRSELLTQHLSLGSRVDPKCLQTLYAIRHAIDGMPENELGAAIYYWVDEMTHEEIAACLGCSRRQVGKLLERFVQRAHKKLTKVSVSPSPVRSHGVIHE